jgi:hypothetical protein
MSAPTYYDQPCPVCGRSLRIPVQYQGRQVRCRHCHGQFEAYDPSSADYPPEESGVALLQRADELLSAADSRIVRRVKPAAK